MPAVVVVGAQWGDEAKGRIVDLLASDVQMVVRYGGGSNAGHSLQVGGDRTVLHLIPSGILHPETLNIISDGAVVDPVVLWREIEGLETKGVSTGNLKVSANAHVVMAWHRELDRLEEERKGAGKLGTTHQGIGPAYEDKAKRCGLRMADLVDPARLEERLDAVLSDKNFLIQHLFGAQPLDRKALLDQYRELGDRIRPHVTDTSALVYRAVANRERVLFEGAQGTMLDIDHGTYPFVTSSHPVAGGACIGTGIGPRMVDWVIGVTKSYTTRVGTGHFATEMLDEIGDGIRVRGNEFGSTTGRPRRIGWLDAVGLRFAVRVNSLDRIALTLLDVLSGLERVRICTAYDCDGTVSTDLPADRSLVERARPIYEDLPGWSEDITGVTRFEDLPAAAQQYVRRVEDLIGVPAAMICVGPDREQTIHCEPDMFRRLAA